MYEIMMRFTLYKKLLCESFLNFSFQFLIKKNCQSFAFFFESESLYKLKLLQNRSKIKVQKNQDLTNTVILTYIKSIFTLKLVAYLTKFKFKIKR